MVKLAKRDKRKHLKAQVYFSYGKFAYGFNRDEAEYNKYLSKSITLFKSLGLNEGVEEVNKFLEEIEKSKNQVNPEHEDINTT